MPSLPYDGESSWGDVLNTYITSLASTASTTQTGLQNHAGNSPADPHGDRAYAQTLVSPFTTGLNTANGLVKLNGSGTIPPALITASSAIGGMYSAVVDAISMFGMTAGTGTDQSTYLQNALNYVGTAGGGIVYIGPGTFSLSNYVYFSSNTWLMMSPGTVIQRIPGSPNAPYLFSNIQFTSSGSVANNIRITGGQLNAVGSFTITTDCTLIEMFSANNVYISDVDFYAPASNSHAIELNGVTSAFVSNCTFDGVQPTTQPSNSAVLINASNSNTSSSGLNTALYTGNGASGVIISNCVLNGGEYGAYGCLAGSDVSNSGDITNYNITVTGCTFVPASQVGPIYTNSASWQWALFSGNSWGDGKGNSSAGTVNGSIPFDTWAACTLASGWTNASGGYPLQYKISQDGTVTIMGYINVATNETSTITTLPYHPSYPVYAQVAWANTTEAFTVEVATTGKLAFTYNPTGIAANPAFINFTFPADYSGNGVIA